MGRAGGNGPDTVPAEVPRRAEALRPAHLRSGQAVCLEPSLSGLRSLLVVVHIGCDRAQIRTDHGGRNAVVLRDQSGRERLFYPARAGLIVDQSTASFEIAAARTAAARRRN